MVFAEFIEAPEYERLAKLLAARYEDVRHGNQGDWYIWILRDNEKVAIDNFDSLSFQVKCADSEGNLLPEILDFLGSTHQLRLIDPPEEEPFS